MGLFNGETESSIKFINDYRKLHRILNVFRSELNRSVVATIGTWDMLHIGHVRYLMEAKKAGDVLVVGVDTDKVVRKYKGKYRPVVPFEERVEMLSYLWCVDFITGIRDVNDKGLWTYGLIRMIRPNVFVAVEDSYPPEQRADIEKYVDKLVILPRQAENTSTSFLVQRIIKGHMAQINQIGKNERRK